MSLLITPDALADLIAGSAPVRILDVRWRLDRPDGRPEYLAGHIPGAVYVDLGRELAAHGEPTDGRHPLPSATQLGQAARRWGINDGDTVVIYDDFTSFAASRAWWVLADAGLPDVRILDGALAGWVASGRPLEEGTVVPEPGAVTLGRGFLPRLSIDDAARLPDSGVLLDVRAAERYRGDSEPLDPRAGHVPGAVNAPTTGNVDADGRFLEPEALRERFEQFGVSDDRPVGVYCGSGITAAHTALALTLAGFAPQLYPGSWSQWSNHPDRPVALGSEPGGRP
ncbi:MULTISPECIES: sulfurtransferase [unclassified Microbacterium]|uniref:sulfurtransferase n=1 Tax=unclassified Microbacterium TaxID=2609290 RepID=UPI00214B9083|nr:MULTISPECIES: sulfurtransferase [unclassified Microbacterium]MCR2783600.1 sulfurtransferase [Microbacterium sp. zg.B96]WIM15541.1 sulfurtransferase [Microbacterium sp. zg-B96]